MKKHNTYLLLIVAFLLYEHIGAQTTTNIDAQNKFIQYDGRIGLENSGVAEIYWPGSSWKIKFRGTDVKAILKDEQGDNYYDIIVDDTDIHVLKLDTAKKEYTLASRLSAGVHTIELFRRTGWTRGITWFYGFSLPAHSTVLKLPLKNRTIEFYGNSITAGAAVEDYAYAPGDTTDTNNYLSYAAITARYFDAKYSCIASSGIGLMVSWGSLIMPEIYNRLNPGDSSSKWDFSKSTPGVVVINLMQNDNALVDIPEHPQFKR